MASSEIMLPIAFGSGFLLVFAVKLIQKFFSERKKDYPKDVVILFQLPKSPGAMNVSPFGTKLETYLRMAKIPYQIEYSSKMSPKHKVPWVMFNGQVISDTQFIIEFLNKKFDVDLSKQLTSQEKAISHAMRKMIEESFYWAAALSLWVHDYDHSNMSKHITLGRFILWRIRSSVKHMAYCQGYGRHAPEEVEVICRQDLQALADHIGGNKYLMGNHPCEADCAVFGMLSGLSKMPEKSYLKKIVKDNVYPNLTAYYENMKKEFWSDCE